ncbi:MAG: hypothetical protein H6652_10905 [Ardenticatenaceae bacterium]|nr:hypothetical protein [Ardenticatenaceae bacterium]MCB8948932.1 hypothetical protein [Ardenticatenaceae bacterium]
MTSRIMLSQWLGHKEATVETHAIATYRPNELIVQERPLPTAPKSTPIIIPSYQTSQTVHTLSNFLQIGRMYHSLCRNAFVEKVQIGYYAYERREEWRTCALAAAYAGAFGPQSIERPDFSYSMAIWRLSQRVGFDIGKREVVGPTGRHNNLADEMIKLVDENLWTRAGVAEWVASLGY